MTDLNMGRKKKGKVYLAQRLNMDPNESASMLRGYCFKVGDKVRCVDRKRPEIYGEIRVVKMVDTTIGILHVDFRTTLDNHVPIELRPCPECLYNWLYRNQLSPTRSGELAQSWLESRSRKEHKLGDYWQTSQGQ
jgi:hypothetical protein